VVCVLGAGGSRHVECRETWQCQRTAFHIARGLVCGPRHGVTAPTSHSPRYRTMPGTHVSVVNSYEAACERTGAAQGPQRNSARAHSTQQHAAAHSSACSCATQQPSVLRHAQVAMGLECEVGRQPALFLSKDSPATRHSASTHCCCPTRRCGTAPRHPPPPPSPHTSENVPVSLVSSVDLPTEGKPASR
jgi:hypothetical protein